MLPKDFYCPSKLRVGFYTGYYREDAYVCHNSSSIEEMKPGRFGYPTCYYYLEKWLNLDKFETLTGYRPSTQADKFVELSKTVYGKVDEIDNVPTDGFRIVAGGNIGLLVVEDPRGFMVKVEDLLPYWIYQGIDVKDGVLQGKFVYAWERNRIFPHLLPVNGNEYREETDFEEEIAKQKKVTKESSLKLDDLVPGKIYCAYKITRGDISIGENCLYMGQQECFNRLNMYKLIESAVFNCYNYIIEELKGRKDASGTAHPYPWLWKDTDWPKLAKDALKSWKKRHVFIKLKPAIGKDSWKMSPNIMPYWVFMNSFVDSQPKCEGHISAYDIFAPGADYVIREKNNPIMPAKFPYYDTDPAKLVDAFERWQRYFKQRFDNALQWLPLEEPEDLEQWYEAVKRGISMNYGIFNYGGGKKTGFFFERNLDVYRNPST